MLPHHSDWVIIGSVGKPFGVKGFCFFDTYTTPTTHAMDFLPWHDFADPQNPKRLEIEALRAHNKRLVGRIHDCHSPEDTRIYTGHQLAIARSQLPELETGFYWHDLIGLNVIDQQGQNLGCVREIFHNGSNDVILIEKDREMHTIAYTKQAVLNVDLITKTIEVDADHVL